MLKFERIAVQRTDKICVLHHGEQQTFRDGTQDGVVYRQGFRSAANVNVLSSTPVRLYRARLPLFSVDFEPTIWRGSV